MCSLYTLLNVEMIPGLLHLEQESTYSVQSSCMSIIIDSEQKNVLVPDCVAKTYSLQLLHTNMKLIKILYDWLPKASCLHNVIKTLTSPKCAKNGERKFADNGLV
jgi:hypothetical protein